MISKGYFRNEKKYVLSNIFAPVLFFPCKHPNGYFDPSLGKMLRFMHQSWDSSFTCIHNIGIHRKSWPYRVNPHFFTIHSLEQSRQWAALTQGLALDLKNPNSVCTFMFQLLFSSVFMCLKVFMYL